MSDGVCVQSACVLYECGKVCESSSQLIEHHVVCCNRSLSVHIVAENGPRHSSNSKCDLTKARSHPSLVEKIMNVIRGCVPTDGFFLIHEFASITHLRSSVSSAISHEGSL